MTDSKADHPAVQPTIDALKQARTHLQQNDVRAAQRVLETARDSLMGHPAGEARVQEMKTAVFAELGLLHQRLADPDEALAAFGNAADLARGLMQRTGEAKHTLQLSTTLINSAGMYARREDPQTGLDQVNEALQLLRKMEEDGSPTRRILLLGGLQNQASLLLAMKNPPAAEGCLSEALEIANGLLTEAPQLIAQAIELSSRKGMVQRMQGKLDEALGSQQHAARLAEAAYQGGAQQGLVWYVNTQMQLVDAHFVRRELSAAEDHLWKAIDAASAPQTMLLGTNFYCTLLRLSDDELESGGLPRAEVVEALDELIGRMEEKKAPEDLMAVVRARYGVLVDGDIAGGESVLSSQQSGDRDLTPGARELHKHLSSDLSWRKGE
jgi:tetratricopeptide (TPR) repeat protein